MKVQLVLILIIGFVLKCGQSANILCVYSTMSHSHFLFAEPLLVELSRRGHNVTVVSQYAKPVPIANYTAIIVPLNKDLPEAMKIFTESVGDKLIVLRGLLRMTKVFQDIMRETLDLPEMKTIYQHGNIDLLITETGIGETFLGLAAKLNCSSIQIASMPPTLDFFARMGNPMSISYVPNTYLSSTGEQMGFVARVTHFLVALFEMAIFHILTRITTSSVYNEYFPPPQYPTIVEMKRELSLLMINTHFSQGIVRPLVPGIIEVSGLHIMPTKPLPTDLADYMDNSSNGVILFSLGTNVQSSSMSALQMDILLGTFRNLKENVLWKIDEVPIKSLPANVKIAKWLPQNDLLAHPKLKLFITHGGLGSIIEAKYHGVPLVIMPVFGDQIGNAEQVASEGWGRMLALSNLTALDFQDAVNDVLQNTSYRERIQNLSRLYRDRPQTPMETAVFWVEYVLRHKGAVQMKSNARHLNFFQLHSIDVIGFLLASLLLTCGIVYWFVKLLIYGCCRMFRNKIKND